ncbi:uncharacterized protein LOC119425505 [Nematolebias whitei]|uniref:uncharacterized protein LOC119425505 n=1 Tax=Nematolebias whitei TaxID=451745 RepID=UPI0018989304|nr:uncharacterized protein LOC119425505 [Nematolebias whitei]
MGRFSAHFILKLLCLLLPVNSSLSYSLKNCTVEYQEELSADVSLNCISRGLLTVPNDLPKNTVSLYLNGNLLEKINTDDFCHVLKLKTLVLLNNKISHVDDGSFANLVLLKKLDVANNFLTNLTSKMFQGLSNLTELYLSLNRIELIHEAAFQFLTSLQTLDLSDNKIYQIADIQPILQLPKIQMLSLTCNSFSSFETKDLQLNHSSSLKNLSVSGYDLNRFSIATLIFPYLQNLDLSTCTDNNITLNWDIPDKTLLENITKVSVEGLKFSLEEIQKVLQSFSSLRYLFLNNLTMRIKRGLFSTVCKIATLQRLDLFDRRLNYLTFELTPCSQLTELRLSFTLISELPKGSIQSMKKLRFLDVTQNQLTKVPYDIKTLSFLEILKMENNLISALSCEDFMNTKHLRELSLNRNKITNLDRCVFENLPDLRRLDLSNNLLPRFGDRFMISLQQLEVLDMNHNSIKTFTPDGFEGLRSLKQLNVEFHVGKTNKIFNGLENMKSDNALLAPKSEVNLSVLQNLESLTIYFRSSISLKMCQSNIYKNLFSLNSLKRLTMIWNINIYFTPHGKYNILEDMKHLETFTAENMFSETVNVDTFQFNPKLRSLKITKTVIKYLEPKLFQPLPNLEILDLSESKLKSLDFLVQANLSALRYLNLRDSEVTVINMAALNSLPSLTYLDLSDNPFTCECSNAGFIQWIGRNKQTQVVNAHQYKCLFPVDRRGTLLLDFNIKSCWNDGSFFYFISSSCLVVLTLLTSFIYHFLKWQLAYTFHLFLAFLYDSKMRKKGDPHQFDAFVSYNVHDEDWVYREMLPVLEGEQGWRLCLHHRDFQPGKPIMENITDAIYGSRKTICVISRHYLQSEWCSREIQMASFRLFDEQKDVLILLFLEEIPPHHLSPYYRMRKLVKKRTYLSWPQAGQHPGVFWQNVQRALQTGDALTEDTDLLTGPTVLATMGSLLLHYMQNLTCLLFLTSPSLAYSLKNCSISYQENSSVGVYLHCAENELITVPDDIPRDAAYITLFNNILIKIYKEDFAGMSKLKYMDISSNQIAFVDNGSFVDLVSLKTLEMSENNITSLTGNMFQGLSNLTVLYLSGNKIQFINTSAVQFLVNLQELYLGKNKFHQLADIQFILQLPQIQRLELRRTTLSSFETKDLPLNSSSSLKELLVEGLNFKKFSITTPVFPNLQMLDFGIIKFNHTMMWEIPDKTLLKNITDLYINQLVLSFKGIQKVLKSLDKLKNLRLNYVQMWIKKGLLSTVCKIPTMRKLELHNIKWNNWTLNLAPCSQLTELNLQTTYISDLQTGFIQSLKNLRSLILVNNQLTKVPPGIRSLTLLEILSMDSNVISQLTCEDFVNMTHLTALSLSSNHIIKLDKCVFKSLTELKFLDVSNNLLQTFEDTFNVSLHKLEILEISHNPLITLGMGDFQGLKSLKQLDVTSMSLEKLTCKTVLGLNNLKALTVFLPRESEIDFRELKHIEMITIYTNAGSAFKIPQLTSYEAQTHLTFLKSLTVINSGTSFALPKQMFQIFKHLEYFKANRVYGNPPDVDTFQFNSQLKTLIFADSDLSHLNPGLFLPIPNLEILGLSLSKFKSLDFLAQANLSALRYLEVTDNEINVINETVFQFLPSLTYLNLDNNPFICKCSNAGFIQWLKGNKQTQVVNAYRYKCSFPVDKQGTLLLDFDIKSCWNDGSFFYFISSSCLVVLTLLTSFFYHFLKWHLANTFQLLLAFLYDNKMRKKGDPHQFDAFVSYNVHDEDWVYREMLPVLEGQQGWRLCLHHRDFQPGKPIMENISDAIYGSRKTICVISHHYLQSEWCSREIQMASFRLFDEQKDVLILLFLEEIPPHHLSPYYRMRKLVKKRTYLSWPQAAQHPGVFWQNVQRALQTGDALTEDTDLLTGPTGR